MSGTTRRIVAGLLAAGLGLTAGCAATAAPAAGASSASGGLAVVAAENFYGDLATSIGGDLVSVTSILTSPDQDPHLFEPGTRVGLSVAQARVVIGNGLGYDDWLDKLLAAAPSTHRTVLKVSDVLGVTGADANPHLWYDTPKLPTVVAAIGASFAAADPAHADRYRAGVVSTDKALQPLLDAVHQLGVDHPNAAVAYTEPVPALLLQAAGLRSLTPASFARAIEDGTDPAPADVATMRRLLTQHDVKALLYNVQATSPVTQQLQDLATSAGVPIVAVSETPPPGQTFVAWQLGQVRALDAALRP
jgi:zinc/manganese transport system substrate-binding protein